MLVSVRIASFAGQPNNDDFFRLFGDTDGDGDVDGQDYGQFGLRFMTRRL